jgi:ankyrin repeat protein
MNPQVGISMATLTSKTISGKVGVTTAYYLMLTLFIGCGEIPSKVTDTMLNNQSFHQKFGWKAEKFFDDPKVIALCKAIEANDLNQIERLIAEGADVNATGKGNMTPLMWSFPDDKLERFVMLLEAGADPNVKFTSNLEVPSAFAIGNSVTTQSAKSRFPGHFAAVMRHGGDANITDGFRMPLIHIIILAMLPDAKERCKLVLEAGCDIDILFDGGTPAIQAFATGGQYDLAIFLFEQGADPLAYREDGLQQAIHMILRRENDLQLLNESDRKKFFELRKFLVDNGADEAAARKDLERWSEKIMTPSGFKSRWQIELKAKRDSANMQ